MMRAISIPAARQRARLSCTREGLRCGEILKRRAWCRQIVAEWRLMLRKIVFGEWEGRCRSLGRERERVRRLVLISWCVFQNGLVVVFEEGLDGEERWRWWRMRPVRLVMTTMPAKEERSGALSEFSASGREIPGPGVFCSNASSEDGR
jgi:hypothetical protein